MNVRFRGHNYRTQVTHNLRNFLWLDQYHGWKWRYRHLTWVGHGGGCCDYWTPIDDPKAQRALMLDDELGLSQRLNQTVSDTEPGENASGGGSQNSIDNILKPWLGFVHSEYDGTSLLEDQLNVIEQAKQQIKEWAYQEIQAELQRMWNKTQPDLVPEGWTPTTPEGIYLLKRLGEYQKEEQL